MKITFDSFVKQITAQFVMGRNKFPVHKCSICGYQCGYIIFRHEGAIGVSYDNGCYCTRIVSVSPRSGGDMFRHLDMQSDLEPGKGYDYVMKEWGLIHEKPLSSELIKGK